MNNRSNLKKLIAKGCLTKNARLHTIKPQNLFVYARLKAATETDTGIRYVSLRYDSLRELSRVIFIAFQVHNH